MVFQQLCKAFAMSGLMSAIKVLEAFVDCDEESSVNEIATRLKLNKSHVSKILKILREAGYVEQNLQTRRYSVGPEAFQVGMNYIHQSKPARDALPIMRQMVDNCGHTVTLSVLHNENALHILAVEGPQYVDGRWRAGKRLPVHATSAGQVLLAWLSLEDRSRLLDRIALTKFTEQTIVERNALESVLVDVQNRGYSVTVGQSAPGLAAVAVPVFDRHFIVQYALGLVVPASLFELAEKNDLKVLLFEGARSLSLKLGASDYPLNLNGQSNHMA